LFGYQLPWKENIYTLTRLAKGGLILELGSGIGLWGRMLTEAGAKIVCTDDKSWSLYPSWELGYHPVENLNWMQAVLRYSEAQLLLMIWPPAGECPGLVEALREFRGPDVVLIGEQGRLTGGDALLDELSKWPARLGEMLPYEYRVYQPNGFDNLGLFHWHRKVKPQTV
jgi:hypothetical protein